MSLKIANYDLLKNEILALPPETLVARGIITLANDQETYTCPFCGSGQHSDNGDGIKPNSENGVVLWHCFACNKSFNNIHILAQYYNLSNNGTGHIEIIKNACKDFGFDFVSSKENDESELIKTDIEKSRYNLKNFIEHCNGLWRGLTLETLENHGCGYLEHWKQPKNILDNVKIESSRRVIIPTVDGLHYNAVSLQEDRAATNKKYWKIHAGKKYPFGIEFVNKETNAIVVVESETDAMALNQVFGYKFRNAVATCGAGVAKNVTKVFFETLDKFFADNDKKPIILILFDNDNGGKNAPNFCNECVKHGYPAVYDFYSDSDEKVDANSILETQGEDALRKATAEIFRRNSNNFDTIRKQILEMQTDKFNAANSFFSPEQCYRYFRQLNGLNDIDNANRFAELLKYELGDPIRYMKDTDRWASYESTSGVWLVNSNSNNTALTPHVKQAASILSANAKTEHDKKIASVYGNSRRFNPSVFFLKFNELITISTKDLDTHKNLLNVENGVVDLENGKFYPHSPVIDFNGQSAYFSQMAKAQWRGLDYRFELIEKTLAEILPDEEDRHAFLMWMAYSFTGESNEEKFLFMDGDGGNGKGTLTKVWLQIANNYGVSFPVEAVAMTNKFDANAPTPALTMLEKARVAISEEIPQGLPLNQAKIKSLTGSDPIPVMPKFQEYHLIEDPTHTLILSGNFLPDLSNAKDAGIIRRLRRIIFSQNFRDNPNLQLKQQLLTSDARAAWLALIVRHAIEWYKNGLPTSSNMQKAADDYFKSQDFLATFTDDFCKLNRDLYIPRKDFLKKLREEYPKETRAFSDRDLTTMIEKLDGVCYKRLHGPFVFCGIGWNDAEEQMTFDDEFYSSAE